MKNKVASGLFWKLLENGGAQGIQFVIAILLARLLTPAEYGVVGIIMIFITIANVFVQSGFSTALVQKKQADEVDFSSVCYFELAASVVFYALLYLVAPVIAEFYAIPVLKPIVRVLGIVLFPGAVISVQTAYVSRSMEFRGCFLHAGGFGNLRCHQHFHGVPGPGRVGHGGAADQLLHQFDGRTVSHGFLEAGAVLWF